MPGTYRPAGHTLLPHVAGVHQLTFIQLGSPLQLLQPLDKPVCGGSGEKVRPVGLGEHGVSLSQACEERGSLQKRRTAQEGLPGRRVMFYRARDPHTTGKQGTGRAPPRQLLR